MLRTLAVLACLALPSLAHAQAGQPDIDFRIDGVRYDDALPTPTDGLGFQLGERPVRHHEMVRYLRDLAERSDRISVETIGYSHEGRPILFFVVTSPDNHARIDEIRSAHRDALTPEGNAEADTPVVTWINYGVHGAESSAMDAAIPTLYHLAAAEGDGVERTLDDSVILITAIFNPDGHTRRIDHVERFSSEVPVTNPDHIQHDLWIEARTNHYWFDLNRQWLLLTQPEPRAWVEKWHAWKPVVTGDFHEMGSEATYYFHPGEPKRKNPLIPDQARELALAIAEEHAAVLDQEGRLYYSEEGFDNFYVGKGSTYPQVNGGVGILFEAGAARGGLVESQSGLRSYRQNIHSHFLTSLSTIDGALANKDALQSYQRGFFREAVDQAGADPTKAYVFKAEGDVTRTQMFVDLLTRHDIDVYALREQREIDDVVYSPDDSFIVPMAQDQYPMLRAIFDTPKAFEENIFYDVSGWTLPLAYDLNFADLDRRAFSDDLIGEPAVVAFEAADTPERSAYGYVFEWSDFHAPRALHRVTSEALLARVAMEPFTASTSEGPVAFGRGAIFVPLAGQDERGDDIHAVMTEIAREDGITVHPIISGATPSVGTDFGGRISFQPVEAPRVLLLFDDGLSFYDVGEVWHLLDHRMAMPVTMVRKSELGGIDWPRYTDIIMVGSRGEMSMPDEHRQRLHQWIEAGGTLIATRQSALWAQDHFLEASHQNGADNEDGPSLSNGSEEGGDTTSPARFDYADRALKDAEHVIGGSIMATDLDITHPLGFGYADRFLPSHRNTTLTLEAPADNPFAVVARYTEDPLLSGYASERRLNEIAGTPMLRAERVRGGAVIAFTDNPVFRGTFLGTNKAFLNAIFFGDLIQPPRGDYGPYEGQDASD